MQASVSIAQCETPAEAEAQTPQPVEATIVEADDGQESRAGEAAPSLGLAQAVC
jgi:hypothetical protein